MNDMNAKTVPFDFLSWSNINQSHVTHRSVSSMIACLDLEYVDSPECQVYFGLQEDSEINYGLSFLIWNTFSTMNNLYTKWMKVSFYNFIIWAPKKIEWSEFDKNIALHTHSWMETHDYEIENNLSTNCYQRISAYTHTTEDMRTSVFKKIPLGLYWCQTLSPGK